jgi:hypothetical protein
MIGPYIRSIDPIIADLFGVHLWWYGLSYTLGFGCLLARGGPRSLLDGLVKAQALTPMPRRAVARANARPGATNPAIRVRS